MTVDELFPLPQVLPPRPGRSPYGSLYERLVANSVLLHEDNCQSCWVWTAKVKAGAGYPLINVWIDGKVVTRRAHRVMVEQITESEIEILYEVDHLCHNASCINPDHLRVTTQIINLSNRRGYKPVRQPLSLVSSSSS